MVGDSELHEWQFFIFHVFATHLSEPRVAGVRFGSLQLGSEPRVAGFRFGSLQVGVRNSELQASASEACNSGFGTQICELPLRKLAAQASTFL